MNFFNELKKKKKKETKAQKLYLGRKQSYDREVGRQAGKASRRVCACVCDLSTFTAITGGDERLRLETLDTGRQHGKTRGMAQQPRVETTAEQELSGGGTGGRGTSQQPRCQTLRAEWRLNLPLSLSQLHQTDKGVGGWE